MCVTAHKGRKEGRKKFTVYQERMNERTNEALIII